MGQRTTIRRDLFSAETMSKLKERESEMDAGIALVLTASDEEPAAEPEPKKEPKVA